MAEEPATVFNLDDVELLCTRQAPRRHDGPADATQVLTDLAF